MADILNFDSETKAYFDTLPPLIKEQIMQTGMKLSSKKDLQDFAENTLRSGDN